MSRAHLIVEGLEDRSLPSLLGSPLSSILSPVVQNIAGLTAPILGQSLATIVSNTAPSTQTEVNNTLTIPVSNPVVDTALFNVVNVLQPLTNAVTQTLTAAAAPVNSLLQPVESAPSVFAPTPPASSDPPAPAPSLPQIVAAIPQTIQLLTVQPASPTNPASNPVSGSPAATSGSTPTPASSATSAQTPGSSTQQSTSPNGAQPSGNSVMEVSFSEIIVPTESPVGPFSPAATSPSFIEPTAIEPGLAPNFGLSAFPVFAAGPNYLNVSYTPLLPVAAISSTIIPPTPSVVQNNPGPMFDMLVADQVGPVGPRRQSDEADTSPMEFGPGREDQPQEQLPPSNTNESDLRAEPAPGISSQPESLDRAVRQFLDELEGGSNPSDETASSFSWSLGAGSLLSAVALELTRRRVADAARKRDRALQTWGDAPYSIPGLPGALGFDDE